MGRVIVTGAGGALGAAVARRLAGEQLVLVDIPAAGDRLRGLARELGGETSFSLDARSLREGGAVTGAVLCAGGFAADGPLHAAADDATFDRMMALNAATVHTALRLILPGMVAAGRGSVVVVGARQVARPWTGAGSAAYVASKAAVVALAEAAAAEVLGHGVRVNAVLPSILDTPANRGAMPDEDPARWVALDSLAGIVAFLLSNEARDVTGAAVPVYGRA